MAGTKVIDVLYTLSRYPTITMSLSFVLRLFNINAPSTVTDQAYEVTAPMLTFKSNVFSYSPVSSDRLLTHTATLADGSALPAFISYSVTSVDVTFNVLS
jgi:hypothetical protein